MTATNLRATSRIGVDPDAEALISVALDVIGTLLHISFVVARNGRAVVESRTSDGYGVPASQQKEAVALQAATV